MKEHPGEEELQQFVLERDSIDAKIIGHITSCNRCKAKVEVYGRLFTGIKNQPPVAFDFDLTASVLAALPDAGTKPHADRKLIFGIICFSVVFVIAAWFILNEYVPGIFSVSNGILIYLFMTTIITIFIFQAADMFRNYQNKIKSLDFN
jgi:hypothetical protein